MLGFLKNISPLELGIIALILIVLFGSKLVINLGKRSGETVRELKKIKKGFSDAVEGVDENKS